MSKKKKKQVKRQRKREKRITKALMNAFETGEQVSVLLYGRQDIMVGIVYKALREGEDMLFYLQYGPCDQRDTFGFFASDVRNLSVEPKWVFKE